MLLLIDVTRNEVLEALAKRVQLRMVVRALLPRYPNRLLLQFVRVTALRRQMGIIAVRVHMGASATRIILLNFRVGCPLSVNVQRLKHVLHVLELFCLQSRVNTIDHVVVRLLLLLLHLRELLKVLLPNSIKTG